MIKTYPDRTAAENELRIAGFKPSPRGYWVKEYFVASIHPIPGTAFVRVATKRR